MKKQNTLIFKLIFLLFTAYVITATSYKRDGTIGVTSLWGVSTTCPNATVNNETLKVDNNGYLMDPPYRTFLHYGLPVSGLRVGVDNFITGSINGVTRECTLSSQLDGGSGKNLSIYSCLENGVAICAVTFTPQ